MREHRKNFLSILVKNIHTKEINYKKNHMYNLIKHFNFFLNTV